MNKKGQATTELLLLIPLFIILAGGALCVGYMCWQGLKVQQAANLAARIQGQERIGGGTTTDSIQMDNGIGGDTDFDSTMVTQLATNPHALDGFKGQTVPGGVYGDVYRAVRGFFSPGEWNKLFIPAPKTGLSIDRVKVKRVLNPPKIWGDFKIQPVMLEATAYGGEDTHMYGLPRWGSTAGSGPKFYRTKIKGSD